MNHELVTVRRTTFLRAILGGHLVNIVVGLGVFCLVHWLLGLTVMHAITATIVATIVISVLVSVLTTKRMSHSMKSINQELDEIHNKVDQTTLELQKARQDTSALLEELPVGLISFDSNLKLTKVNKRAMQLLDMEPDKIDAGAVFTILKQMNSRGAPVNFIDWLHQAKATQIQVRERWAMVTMATQLGKKTVDVLATYNKSDTYGHELVILLVDRSQESGRQEKQMEFISLAAHELRGPISVMRGLIDVFETEAKDKMTPDQKELLTRLGVSARQLAGYVDNILNTSRVEQDNFVVQKSEGDWLKLLQQGTADLAIRAEAHHRHLDLQLPSELPTIAVDPAAIQHVINNLVDNAIKYSKIDGTVVVTVKLKDDMVETTVQDFGMGIPASVVDNLFTKFYRSHKSKQVVSGTGLGLYLCKAIVEAHGGNIWVRSTEGLGTTFGFSLPTYTSVAASLQSGDNADSGIIRGSHGWIKNHALVRR